jgi:hypothetical protein
VARRALVTGRVPREWREIVQQRKTILGWPAWSDPPALPSSKTAPTRRTELHSLAAETIETLIPLADLSGVGLEGVRLGLNAWAYRRMHEVTATLEVPGHRRFVNIARVDAWPADPHFNLRTRQHPDLRQLPPVIEGSHVHRFDENAKLGISAFAPYSNLPVAAPIEELTSFRHFLRIVGEEFGIDGLPDIDPPNWQELIV